MSHTNLLLGLLSLLVWVALYVLYYRERLLPWVINRFTWDRRPKKVKIENGYYPDGVPIPFRDSFFPSSRPADDEGEAGMRENRDDARQARPATGQDGDGKPESPSSSPHEAEEPTARKAPEKRKEAP